MIAMTTRSSTSVKPLFFSKETAAITILQTTGRFETFRILSDIGKATAPDRIQTVPLWVMPNRHERKGVSADRLAGVSPRRISKSFLTQVVSPCKRIERNHLKIFSAVLGGIISSCRGFPWRPGFRGQRPFGARRVLLPG